MEVRVTGLLQLGSGSAPEGEQKAQLVHREGGDGDQPGAGYQTRSAPGGSTEHATVNIPQQLA